MEKKTIQSVKWKCVINFPTDYDEGGKTYLAPSVVSRHLDELAQEFGAHYWCILHDADFDEDKKIKRCHYHLVIRFQNRRTLNKVIDVISDYLGVPTNCVSVRKSEDLTHDLRYLVHLDDSEKTLYLPSDVYSNRLCDFNVAINTEGALNSESLLLIMKECKYDYSSIILRIGLENARKYHFVINSLIKGA